MKKVFPLLLILFLFSAQQVCAQDYLYGRKKERKKVWRHWGKKKDAYNPYLDKKKKNKPSAQIDKSVKRESKKQERRYKRQLRRSRRR